MFRDVLATNRCDSTQPRNMTGNIMRFIGRAKKKRALQVKDAKEVQARSDRGTRTAGSQGSTRCQSAILVR